MPDDPERFGFGEDNAAAPVLTRRTSDRMLVKSDRTTTTSPDVRIPETKDGVAPFPDIFPDYTGRLWIRVENKTHRHGMIIMELKKSGFEWNPDAATYPNMARMKQVISTLSVPDGGANMRKVTLNYYRVDRNHKLLHELGGTEVEEESTESGDWGEYGFSGTKLVTAGEWSYHLNNSTSQVEAKLNDDNSVFTGTNVKHTSVVKSGDITKNIAFHFAEPANARLDGVCTVLLPIEECSTNAKLEELGRYFEAADDAFRTLNDESKHEVSYSAKFGAILQVETTCERFGAKVSLTLTWDITKLDVVDYVAAESSPTWRPAWSPPSFAIVNPATGCEDDLQIGSGRIKIKKVNDSKTGKEKFVAVLTIEMAGEFYEAFELCNYPFDVQPLTIELEASQMTRDDAVFVAEGPPTLPSEVRDTEWCGHGSHSSVEYNEEGKVYCIKMSAVVERYSSVHMFRVVAVLAAISLTSVTSMCKDPDVNCLDRVALTVTLMLTATAYSLVIANSIPTLGYLTLLDKYILSTFAYIIVVIATLVGMEWTDIEDRPDVPQYGLIGSAGLWLFYHLVFAAYIMCAVIPAEEKKGAEHHNCRSRSFYKAVVTVMGSSA